MMSMIWWWRAKSILNSKRKPTILPKSWSFWIIWLLDNHNSVMSRVVQTKILLILNFFMKQLKLYSHPFINQKMKRNKQMQKVSQMLQLIYLLTLWVIIKLMKTNRSFQNNKNSTSKKWWSIHTTKLVRRFLQIHNYILINKLKLKFLMWEILLFWEY